MFSHLLKKKRQTLLSITKMVEFLYDLPLSVCCIQINSCPVLTCAPCVVPLSCAKWFKVRSGFSFCIYWWNCCLPLFKLSFHKNHKHSHNYHRNWSNITDLWWPNNISFCPVGTKWHITFGLWSQIIRVLCNWNTSVMKVSRHIKRSTYVYLCNLDFAVRISILFILLFLKTSKIWLTSSNYY